MEIKVLIATHKRANLPQDSVYLPIHVGKDKKVDIGFIGDNSGDNISLKNPYYSELTAIYWAWKNLDVDYVGLVHYRRFLAKRAGFFMKKRVLSSDDIRQLCEKNLIILPRKRNYYIETLKSHYEHTHDISHLEETRKIMANSWPECLEHYDATLNRKSAHMFNMFIMKKALFNDYCFWLFDILFQLERRIDLSQLSPFDARLFGRISELLLDVWLTKNGYKYKEVCFLEVETQFLLKLKKFLSAKFLNKKYQKSS